MDISMPVMDGVEATRAIRKSEARGTRIPLVALTAHARSEDKERFRAAGFDDILVKPITRDGIRAIIAKFCGGGATADVPAIAPAAGTDVMDNAHLETLAEALGREKMTSILGEFVTEMDEAIESIAASCEGVDAGRSQKPRVHKAAGSSALIGATALRELLVSLEDRIAVGDALNSRDGLRLRRIWQLTRDEIRRRGV
jgi:response regulator RpfG family c-di-GMP phosphodiesterase